MFTEVIYYENDISAQEQAEEERAWLEKEDEHSRRQEGYQGPYGKGQEEAYRIIDDLYSSIEKERRLSDCL